MLRGGSGLPAQLQRETTSVRREYAVLPLCIALMLMNKNACCIGKNVMATGCGMKIVPEEICVWVCREVSLRGRHDVGQGETGRRSDDLLEQREDVELENSQVSVRVGIAQN